MDEAQPIWLSGCPRTATDIFTTKNAFLAFMAIKPQPSLKTNKQTKNYFLVKFFQLLIVDNLTKLGNIVTIFFYSSDFMI